MEQSTKQDKELVTDDDSCPSCKGKSQPGNAYGSDSDDTGFCSESDSDSYPSRRSQAGDDQIALPGGLFKHRSKVSRISKRSGAKANRQGQQRRCSRISGAAQSKDSRSGKKSRRMTVPDGLADVVSRQALDNFNLGLTKEMSFLRAPGNKGNRASAPAENNQRSDLGFHPSQQADAEEIKDINIAAPEGLTRIFSMKTQPSQQTILQEAIPEAESDQEGRTIQFKLDDDKVVYNRQAEKPNFIRNVSDSQSSLTSVMKKSTSQTPPRATSKINSFLKSISKTNGASKPPTSPTKNPQSNQSSGSPVSKKEQSSVSYQKQANSYSPPTIKLQNIRSNSVPPRRPSSAVVEHSPKNSRNASSLLSSQNEEGSYQSSQLGKKVGGSATDKSSPLKVYHEDSPDKRAQSPLIKDFDVASFQKDRKQMPLLKLTQFENDDELEDIDEKFGEDRSNTASIQSFAEEEESFKSSNLTESSNSADANRTGQPEIRAGGRSMSVQGVTANDKELQQPKINLKLKSQIPAVTNSNLSSSGGFAMRKMYTFAGDKAFQDTNLQIPLARKNSNKSKVSNASQSRKTSSRKMKPKMNSRYGRSEKSYLTFNPKQLEQKELNEQYNLKYNNFADSTTFTQKQIMLDQQNKRLYSKSEYDEFQSMKSVLKPRMIALIKDGRDSDQVDSKAQDPNCESESTPQNYEQKCLSERSEPFNSDSDSVYSHVQKNYLETNESIRHEVQLHRDIYHMHPEKVEDMNVNPTINNHLMSQTDSARGCNLLQSVSEEHNFGGFLNRKNQFQNGGKKLSSQSLAKLSGQRKSYTSQNWGLSDCDALSEDDKDESGSGYLEAQIKQEDSEAPIVRNKLQVKRKSSKRMVDSKSNDLSFDIKDEVSISSDEDPTNQLQHGLFMYYFPNKSYIIVHRRKVHGYTQESFNRLGFEYRVRQLAIWINEWPWFDRLSILLIIINSLGLGMLDYQFQNLTFDYPDLVLEMPLVDQLMEQSELFFTIAFATEMTIKMTAMGLMLDKNCYLRDYWNWLDFVVVLGSVLAYIPGFANVSVLRTFRLFKPLRSLKKLPAMKELVVTLLESVYQLTNIFLLLEFALILFSILGLQIWRSITYQRCRLTESPDANGYWPIVPDNPGVCGGTNVCDVDAGQVCGSLYDAQWKDVVNQQNIQDNLGAEGNWGITSFDNIFNAYISMFQATTLEGWYSLMTMIADGYNRFIVITFFISAIQICHYLLVNLTLAVMVYNLRKQKEDEFDALIDKKVDLCNKLEYRKKELQLQTLNEESISARTCIRFFLNTFISFENKSEPLSSRYNYKFVVQLWRLATHPIFRALFILLVLVDVYILAISKHELILDEDYYERRHRASLILLFSNMAFDVELLIRLIALEAKVLFGDRLNLVDILLCITFTTLFVYDQTQADKFSLEYDDLVLSNNFAFLAALRLLRLILVARASASLRVLLDCIVYTLDAIGNFFALLLIFLYVFSLLGMQLFAGRLKFDDNWNKIGVQVTEMSQLDALNVPRSNFDDILQSFLTVFQILIGERWNDIFYDCWRGSSSLTASAYFITLIFIGNIIMMNLFLAMLLGNFERASLGQQVSRQQEKLELLMPTSLVNQASKKEDEATEPNIQSILKPPSVFHTMTPTELKKRRMDRLKNFGNTASSNSKSKLNQSPDAKFMLIAPPTNKVDSSFDSEQSIEQVRERYKNERMDSARAQLDRRVSFAAFAADPFFGIPTEGEQDRDFKLDHFYDEPSPELFEEFSKDLSLQGRPRAQSLQVYPVKRPVIASPQKVRRATIFRPPPLQLTSDIRNNKRKSLSGEKDKPWKMPPKVTVGSFTSYLQKGVETRSPLIGASTPKRSQSHQQSDAEEMKHSRSGQTNFRQHLENLYKSQQKQAVDAFKNRYQSQENNDSSPAYANPDVSPQDRNDIRRALGQQKESGAFFNRPIQPNETGSGTQGLMIQTGDNPMKLAQKSAQLNRQSRSVIHSDLKSAYPETEKINFKDLFSRCWGYMKYSSLFCFHKRTRLRKLLVMIENGGTRKPLFTTVDQLVTYYTQQIKRKRSQSQSSQGSGSEQHSASDCENSDEDQDIYASKTENDKFLEDPNSSGYINEVLTAQKSKHYDPIELRQQAAQIKTMQENGHYDHIFVGNVIKNKGMFYLTDEHDIKIQFPKWYTVTGHQIFQLITNVSVMISSLILAFDDPFAEPESLNQSIMFGFDVFFTIIFVTEALIKILALGFCSTSLSGKNKKAYLQDPWNRLDFFLVIVQLVNIFGQSMFTQASSAQVARGLRALKAMRALRPLRMISRFKGLRIAMSTIVNSGQQIFNVVAMSFIVIIIFAIFSIHLFKGTFYYCAIDGDVELAKTDDRIETKQDCLDLGYDWRKPEDNFDNLINAILNLMVFMTNEGWVTVMQFAVDARGVDLQPKKNANVYAVSFFIIYMVISHVFILNLFVGVIIQRFNSMHEQLQGYTKKEVKKRKWVDIQRLMMKQKLQVKWFVPSGGIQRFFALICLNKYFDFFVYFIITCNVIVLAMPYHGMTDLYQTRLDQTGMLFSIIYNIEAFIKLMGLRWRYFHDKWNIMDLLIVVSSDVGFVLSTFFTVPLTAIIPVIRALRVARVLKLVKGSSGLKVLVEAITNLFLNLINILGLLLLLVFIFAILGMNIFHGVMYRDHYNASTNFRSFSSSILLLVRCITGEGWNLIMTDLGVSDLYNGVECVAGQTHEEWDVDGIRGCGSHFAYLFFFTFVVLSQMVFINLFIAFVLQAYLTSYEENSSLITLEDYGKLTKLWSEYDPKADGLIEPQDVAFLIFELEAPLGRSEDYADVMKRIIDRNENENKTQTQSILQNDQRYVINIERNMILPAKKMMKTLDKMALPIYITNKGHKCHFKDVIFKLTKQALTNHGYNEESDCKEDMMLVTEWHETYETLRTHEKLEETSGSFWAGLFVARLFKQIQLRKKMFKKDKAECISEFNNRKKYSKMLRTQEERERIDDQIQAIREAKEQRNPESNAFLRKHSVPKRVDFKFDDVKVKKDENIGVDYANLSKIFTAQAQSAIKRHQSNAQKSNKNQRQANQHYSRHDEKPRQHGQRDIERFAWWKDPKLHRDSSVGKIKNWIKINDLRYKFEDHKKEINKQAYGCYSRGAGTEIQLQTANELLGSNLVMNRSMQSSSSQSESYNVMLSGEFTPIKPDQEAYKRVDTLDSNNFNLGVSTEGPLIEHRDPSEQGLPDWGSKYLPAVDATSALMALGLPNSAGRKQLGRDFMSDNGVIREENSDMASSSHMTMSASARRNLISSSLEEDAQEYAHLDEQVKEIADMATTNQNSFVGVNNKAISCDAIQSEEHISPKRKLSGNFSDLDHNDYSLDTPHIGGTYSVFRKSQTLANMLGNNDPGKINIIEEEKNDGTSDSINRASRPQSSELNVLSSQDQTSDNSVSKKSESRQDSKEQQNFSHNQRQEASSQLIEDIQAKQNIIDLAKSRDKTALFLKNRILNKQVIPKSQFAFIEQESLEEDSMMFPSKRDTGMSSLSQYNDLVTPQNRVTAKSVSIASDEETITIRKESQEWPSIAQQTQQSQDVSSAHLKNSSSSVSAGSNLSLTGRQPQTKQPPFRNKQNQSATMKVSQFKPRVQKGRSMISLEQDISKHEEFISDDSSVE